MRKQSRGIYEKRYVILLVAQLGAMEAPSECETSASEVRIDNLPDELLDKMLRDLTRWPDKKIRIGSDYSDSELVAVLYAFPQLRNLVLRRVVDSSAIEAVCDNCSHLTTLEMAPSQQISLSLLEKLVQNCANIQSLVISHYFLEDESKARTLAQLHELQSLDIAADSNIINLRPIADGCPKLAKLKITKMFDVSIDNMEYFFNKKCKTLTHVTLPWVSFNGRCVVTLLRDCTSLSYLQLDDCRVVGDEAPEAFTVLGRLSNLRTLVLNDLQGCLPEAAALAFESGGLSSLQVLRITNSKIFDSVLKAVCVHCPELKELYFLGFCDLTRENLNQLYRLSKLETLHLRGIMCVNEGSICCIAQLPKLRELFLGVLTGQDLDRDLWSILDITSLEVLRLYCGLIIRFSPFEMIPEKLVNLRVLDLKGITVYPHLLEWLREQMPGLEVKLEFSDTPWNN